MHGPDAHTLISGSGEQECIPFVLMRGGTSKALFLRGEDLPREPALRDKTILSLFGSPDPRQIDGLGGADLLTSKLAIIDPPSRQDADLDYTFAQVSVTEPVVDYDINCGNISAAVGAFVVDEGLVEIDSPATTVRIHNTNTGRMLEARVPVVDNKAAVEGDCTVHGVPGSGAPIALDFSDTAGGITGALFPTGNTTDLIDTSIGPVEVSILDLGNLAVFLAANSVGLTGTEMPHEFDEASLDAIGAVKEAAARVLGMGGDGLIPVPTLVAAPAPYVSYTTGDKIDSEEIDLLARVVGGRPPVPHKAYPGTIGAGTGVAACVPGTVVHSVTRQAEDGRIRIGHMSGMMPIWARVGGRVPDTTVEQAVYLRTARRIAEGSAFVRVAALSTETSV